MNRVRTHNFSGEALITQVVVNQTTYDHDHDGPRCSFEDTRAIILHVKQHLKDQILFYSN